MKNVKDALERIIWKVFATETELTTRNRKLYTERI
jgi:hypothetical protein